jgi:hypothetical protein
LTAHRQTFPVTDAAITIDRLQTFQITLHLTAKVAFDLDLVIRDRVNDFVQLLRREVFCANVRIDVGLLKNAPCGAKTHSKNVRQGYFDAFVCWNLNS